jgi:hypothetical protein
LLEPLRPMLDTANAAVTRAMVAMRILRGVSHVRWRAWSHDRTPLAPAAAAIAHPAHMARIYVITASCGGETRGAARPVGF